MLGYQSVSSVLLFMFDAMIGSERTAKNTSHSIYNVIIISVLLYNLSQNHFIAGRDSPKWQETKVTGLTTKH